MDGKKNSVWMKRVMEKSLYPCPKQTRNKHQCVFPLPFCVQSITELRKKKQWKFLHSKNRLPVYKFEPDQILVNIIWQQYEIMKKYKGIFFLFCLSVLVVYKSCSLFRGWREGKCGGHHFGVHRSGSHVPLADAYPLHPQAEEGKVFLLRSYMRCYS